MLVALDRGAKDPDFPVIPVLLPGFKKPADIPEFLAQRIWVEFDTLEDREAFHRLVSGIQGKAPGPGDNGGELKKRSHPYRCMAQLPEEWVDRREYGEVLEALCPKDGIQPGRLVGITTALRGGGGFGKTALAQKLCFDERVREAYPDGILWMTMGEDISESGRLSRIRDLIRWWMDKEAPTFETVVAAGAEIRKLLAGSSVLVVTKHRCGVENLSDSVPVPALQRAQFHLHVAPVMVASSRPLARLPPRTDRARRSPGASGSRRTVAARAATRRVGARPRARASASSQIARMSAG